jgi:hypothetical protein
MIYAAVLESLRHEIAADTLVVDPRPRFVVDDGGVVTMGDANEFPDAILSEAIRANPFLASCGDAELSACRPVSRRRVGAVSEILILGTREAGVLASYVNLEVQPITSVELAVRVRFGSGRWRVVKLEHRSAGAQTAGFQTREVR